MKKKLCMLFCAIAVIPALLAPSVAYGAEPFNNLSARSTILMDAKTGEVLVDINSHEKREPASITKIMTMLLTMEAIKRGELDYSDKVTIAEEAAKTGGTQLFLETGEVRTVEDLLYGMAVESANDAANAIAIHLGGTLSQFIAMMNARAAELGMHDTSFNSACGLHEENHYTSAYDVAISSRELLKHPEILKYTNTWMIDVVVGRNDSVRRTLANTNKLISRVGYIDGLKTGYTSEAGHCISATGQIGDLRLICVLMGSRDSETRFSEAHSVMDYGFAAYTASYPVAIGDIICEADVFNADARRVGITVAEDVYELHMKSEQHEYTVETHLIPSRLKAPLKKGDTVGTVDILKNGHIVGTLDAVMAQDVRKCSFFEYFRRMFPEFF
ncbi:MAG: D-alanyl-D-alanine carboxypeptidase [Eubacteriaceae bacterium]|nr:D-alanyl-D-alanine carboxypeptidase [Eubacteriaceae bacterium]